MPVALDPTAVHAIPGGGGCTAFVEPTSRGACALINWRDTPKAAESEGAGKAGTIELGSLTEPSQARAELETRFPQLANSLDDDSGRQFVEQLPSRAATVRCNTYHHGVAVLLGDAAHSTGGASGQGCNSALQDSAALADALEESGGDVQEALLAYSKRRVPEGHALLDLSVGPREEVGFVKRALYGLSSFVSAVGARFHITEPPLQTELTTTLVPFAELRRKRDFFFGDFPDAKAFNAEIVALATEPSV